MSHIPVRNCAACRKKLPKADLIRIVRTPVGTVVLDPGRKMDGRGLYWCGNQSCLNRIRKKGLVQHLLKAEPSKDLYSRLEEVIAGN